MQQIRTRNLSAASQEKRTLTQTVVERLREEIISGQLEAGTMLVEIPTAERLGVSRVPIREATLVLERDGLLVFEGRGRCRVRTLEARDLDEIYSIRLLVEVETFRLAARNHCQSDLDLMHEKIDQIRKSESLTQVTIHDIEFHDLIVDACRHSRLLHLWRIMRGQIQLFTARLQREVSEFNIAVRETAIVTHGEVARIIQSRDEEAAAQCAREHLRLWDQWLHTTKRNGGRS